MAAKDSNNKSKTSKTAHVMSLLSKKQEPAAPAGEPEEAAAAAPAAAPVPPILSSLGADAAVSVQIKNALEDALEEELRGDTPRNGAPAGDPAPVQAEVFVQPEASVQPEAPVQAEPPAPPVPPAPAAPAEPAYTASPEPVQAAPAPAEPAAPQGSAAPAPPPAASSFQAAAPVQPLVPERPGYVNVMQVLVEEKALKYAELFGLCTCDRCMADVKALTLNHLPPKYVVMGQNEMIPKITFYEGKYSSEITAQLLHACDLVYKTPHHGR